MFRFLIPFPGFYLGWGLGSNDAANIFGTAVATRLLRFRHAAILASVFIHFCYRMRSRITDANNIKRLQLFGYPANPADVPCVKSTYRYSTQVQTHGLQQDILSNVARFQ